MYSARPMNQKYQAYAAASMTVGKLRQVIMLYDGAIRFVQQSIEAINQKDYTTRYNMLTKTTDIIMGLQTSLDYDNGGEISKLLYNYYASLDARIFSVHRSNDVTVLEAVVKELRQMRDTWEGIDQEDNNKRAAAAPVIAAPITPKMAPADYIAGAGVSA